MYSIVVLHCNAGYEGFLVKSRVYTLHGPNLKDFFLIRVLDIYYSYNIENLGLAEMDISGWGSNSGFFGAACSLTLLSS